MPLWSTMNDNLFSQKWIIYLPFENKSKGSDGSSGKGMPVDNKHVMAHSSVEWNLSDDVHASIAKLQRNHGYVRLTPLKETSKASLSLHFLSNLLLFFFSEEETLRILNGK